MPSLPLAGSETLHLNGIVQVFDPPMCCPTGICGPGVDPALLAVARDLRWFESRGVTVQRFGLSQEPGAFAGTAVVAELMRRQGDAALPAILVNGRLLAHGRYPTRQSLLDALGANPAATGAEAESCCEPGSGCC